MPESSPTHAALLTPTGRGAVAVIQVSGPQAVDAVDRYFLAANGKKLEAQRVDAIRFGHWGTESGEEVVVCKRADAQTAPSAADGGGGQEESAIPGTPWVPQSAIVEVHCHGGHAAAEAILTDLMEAGCVRLNWQVAVRREASDAIVAESQIALASALTERTAAILLDQFHGALSTAIREIDVLLGHGDVTQAAEKLAKLLERAELGLHLTVPWQIVLAGPPNVGKSSLINSLLGYSRSIVFDQPGTTRDVVTARTAIGGWPVELADTAGLRTSEDELESAGVGLATRSVEQADLVVLVRDATDSDEISLPRLPVKIRILQVRNKIDLTPGVETIPGVLETSAVLGTGIETLLAEMGRALVPRSPEPGTAVPFTERQQAGLERVRIALGSNDSSEARQELQALLSSSRDF